MILDINKIETRSHEIDEARSGISLVYGLPIEQSMQDLVVKLRSIVKKEYRHLFSWIPNDKLHITLLRGKSIEGQFRPAKTVPYELTALLNNSRHIELIIRAIELCDDGAIRIYFQPTSLFPEINSEFLKQISKKLGVFIRKPNHLWMTVANIDYHHFLNMTSTHVEEVFQHHELLALVENKPLIAKESKLVMFSDIAFRDIEVLCEYSFKGT